MRIFAVTALYSFRALFHWLQPVQYLVYRMLFPLAQLTFFALIGEYGGSQRLSFYLVGNAIGVATLSTFGVSQSVADERVQGTLPYILAAPAARVPVFFGRAALHVVDDDDPAIGAHFKHDPPIAHPAAQRSASPARLHAARRRLRPDRRPRSDRRSGRFRRR